mmetsp:Transcript_2749/g.5570  ORF Transcript_2749/g.5570 Transcript_2749/m.5570 type:complete len:145 (-) Transcript_2749:542-976(-)
MFSGMLLADRTKCRFTVPMVCHALLKDYEQLYNLQEPIQTLFNHKKTAEKKLSKPALNKRIIEVDMSFVLANGAFKLSNKYCNDGRTSSNELTNDCDEVIRQSGPPQNTKIYRSYHWKRSERVDSSSKHCFFCQLDCRNSKGCR